MLKNIKPVNYIFGFLYALCIVLGFQCEYFGYINVRSLKGYVLFALVFVTAVLFSAVFWNIIRDYTERVSGDTEESPMALKQKLSGEIIYFGIIWICNFIVFLGVYPGFFVYDAQYELTQTITREFTNQQPIFHVLLMGGIVQGVHKITGNYNISIGVFILFQMTLISLVFAILIRYLEKLKVLNRLGAVLLSVYFGICPVLVMYSLCSAKDGLFAAALVVIYILFDGMVRDSENFFKSKKKPVLLVLSLLFMMLLRSNGIYALVLFSVLALFIFRGSRNLKKLGLIFALSILLFGLTNASMLKLTNAAKWGSKEILTVPIQQLARVYAYDNESLSEEEKAVIERYIPYENLRCYNPKTSDMVKIGFNEEEFTANKNGFFKIWFSVLKNHPVAYLDALCMTSYGLWYPNATIDGYKGNNVFTFTYGDSSYFGYETEEPGYRRSFIPVIDRFYRWISLDVAIQRIPVIRYLFSPGFMLWVMLFFVGFLIYAKRYHEALTYALPLIVIVTSFIGPMSLVRYSFYLWIFVPVILINIFLGKYKG